MKLHPAQSIQHCRTRELPASFSRPGRWQVQVRAPNLELELLDEAEKASPTARGDFFGGRSTFGFCEGFSLCAWGAIGLAAAANLFLKVSAYDDIRGDCQELPPADWFDGARKKSYALVRACLKTLENRRVRARGLQAWAE